MSLKTATYDRRAKALYIYLEPKGSAKVAHTVRSPDGSAVNWDLDENMKVLGVEFLNIELKDITRKDFHEKPKGYVKQDHIQKAD